MVTRSSWYFQLKVVYKELEKLEQDSPLVLEERLLMVT